MTTALVVFVAWLAFLIGGCVGIYYMLRVEASRPHEDDYAPHLPRTLAHWQQYTAAHRN
jgi:hypothetical protein